MSQPDLLIATTNAGKLREYRAAFEALPVRLLSLHDVGLATMDVEETGTTFEENARLKAVAYGEASGLPVIAEDAGLEVDALDGFPGVYSARWAGAVSAAERNEALLARLAHVPWPQRTARFVAVAVLRLPDGDCWSARGEVEGRILFAPRGEGGFGYDPIFYVPEKGRSMAELSREEKNALSHRGRAARALRDVILQLVEAGRL
ncbi:XTP/dITP diphosphohydrolase [Ardenticatena maritima]|uniref:dITP/XTP pyrophosphatase n=1 Tax=Ardenticatena maritima TaxID=872965 RepID=A0A0M9UDS3_9CHLR|nr:RdgB/HAM1 family non-canonical purine NTP pyrophosphatase [Ardenticatena maritima]KPL87868.1 hypothetical protein SE16_10010 [Ardenticatena maritima]GAP64297.1 XTP/dITP diphosphohydrolase [Ardenticatena maritima]